MFNTFAALLFKVFFIILLAYFCCKKGVLTQADRQSLTNLLLNVILYFVVIMTSQQEFSADVGRFIVYVAVFALVYFITAIPLCIWLARRLKLEEKKARIFVDSVVFCNVGFVGYPLLQEMYGSTGLLCGIMFSSVFNLFFYTWGIAYIGTGAHGLKKLFTNKIAMLSIVCITVYFLNIRLPEFIIDTFSSLSNMMTPLCMIVIGCNLAESGLWSCLKQKEYYLPTILRLIVVPALVFGILRLLDVDPQLCKICTLIAALPVATTTSLVATDTNCAPEYATGVMIQSTIAMSVTFPLWLFIVGL